MKIETAEQAAEILTEHRWRSYTWKVGKGGYIETIYENLYPDDAIAIAQGIVDARELAALRKAVEPFARCAARVPADWGDDIFWDHPDELDGTGELIDVPTVANYRTLLAAYEGKE